MKLLNKNPKKNFSYRLLDGFISGISRILCSFNIDFNSFVEALKIKTVLESYEQTGQIIKTSLVTGVDRRQVSAIINSSFYCVKSEKQSSEIRVLEHIAVFAKQKNGIIDKKGALNSLQAILKRCGYSHIKTSTFVSLLVDRGAIKDLGEQIMFLGHEYKNIDNHELFIGNISRSIDRYTSTITFNKNKSKTNEGLGLYDKTTYSTQIPPDSYDEVERRLFLMCREFSAQIDSYLSTKEKVAPGTYPEIGITIYQHNSNKRG